MSKFSLRAAIAAGAVPELGADREERIEYIDLAQIDDDPRNFYSLEGLEELAANIELLGLQQPIRVRDNPEQAGRVIIVSGHRRRAALQRLAEEDERWKRVPCIREAGGTSAAMQELRLIFANSDTRKLSSADISKQAERVEALLYQLKEEGYEFPGRMRDHVAEACQVSKSKLARLKVIRENLIPDLLAKWEEGMLKESPAYALAKLCHGYQAAIHAMMLGENRNWQWLYENEVNRHAQTLKQLDELTCPQSGRHCENTDGKWDYISGKDYYSGSCARTCCADCSELGKCRHSCPKLADRAAEIKAAAKEARRREAEEQAAKDQPKIDEITALWRRIGQLRAETGVSVEDYYKAIGRYYAAAVDDPMQQALERGEGITASTNPPFGYTVRLMDIRILCAVAELFGCSVDRLLGREAAAETQQGWISGKQPPEDPDQLAVGKFVLEGMDAPKLLIMRREFGDWCFPNGAKIEMDCVGWMPIPEG